MSAALSDQFGLAYGFTMVCCIYSIGCWLRSDQLKGKRSRSVVVFADGSPYDLPTMRYRLWQIVPTCLLIAFFATSFFFIQRLALTKELGQSEDWLYPASETDPPCNSRYPLPDDAIALYLGNSRLVAGKDVTMWDVLDPQDRRIATPILVVERDSRGGIALDLDVRSKDGKIVARIKRNYFVLNGNNILTKRRPDRSTLIVTDQEGTEVLNVKYLNPHAINLLGTFYVIGQKEPVVINEVTQDMGGSRMMLSGACNDSYGWKGDVSRSLYTSGDGTGNHEYDPPGSAEHPLSPVRKWNADKQEWESQFRHPMGGK